ARACARRSRGERARLRARAVRVVSQRRARRRARRVVVHAVMNVRDVLGASPVIPVLTVSQLQLAVPLARALVRGGLKVLEITLRTECALDAITAMREEVPEAIVGAGTLTRAEDFAAVQRAGGQFAVTPGLTADLLFGAGHTRLPLLPGVMTPT